MVSQAAQDPSAPRLHIRAEPLRVVPARLHHLARTVTALLAVLGELRTARVRQFVLVVFEAADFGASARLHVAAQPLHVLPTGVACWTATFLSSGLDSEEQDRASDRHEQNAAQETSRDAQLPHDPPPCAVRSKCPRAARILQRTDASVQRIQGRTRPLPWAARARSFRGTSARFAVAVERAHVG